MLTTTSNTGRAPPTSLATRKRPCSPCAKVASTIGAADAFFLDAAETLDRGRRVGTLCWTRLELAGATSSVGIGNTEILPEAARVSRLCCVEDGVDEMGTDKAIVRASESKGIEAIILPSAEEPLCVSGTSQTYTNRSASAMVRNRVDGVCEASH